MAPRQSRKQHATGTETVRDSWGCAHAGYVAEQKPTGTQLNPSASIIAEEKTSSIADMFDDFRLFYPLIWVKECHKPPFFR
jgi:hypothetical protein